jgi:hypothetical protein
MTELQVELLFFEYFIFGQSLSENAKKHPQLKYYRSKKGTEPHKLPADSGKVLKVPDKNVI